jgi:hypothetical protein
MKTNPLKMLVIMVILPFFVVTNTSLMAQAKKDKKKTEETKPDEKKDEDIKQLDEVVKKSKKHDGLFTVYQDTTDGKVYIEVSKAQLGKEFIHFSQVTDAAADYFRGAYGWGKIFTINKNFNKIEIVLQNTSYYFDPANALSKAADANINKPVIYSEKIAGISKDKSRYLIEAEKLFLAETFEQIKPSPDPNDKPGQSFKLGTLSKDKSKFIAIKNYPKNSDFGVELVFEDSYPMNGGHEQSITDPRFVSIKMRNSLIEVPQNDYKPRFDDARVGYFTEQVDNMTSTNAAPYRDLVNRWHLKKKDPTAALSEPVEPIVWWIENTTPKAIREHVRNGVLQWNKAFEKAGFKNAIVVNEQPDNADWDADDIRYNVLRWTSSPNPYFGGYGPSFTNPRTGQILGADVMLEYIFLTGRLRQQQLFESAAMDFLHYENDQRYQGCTFASHLQRSVMFGSHVIDALGRDVSETKKILEQSIYRLTLHEVGHTLGLNHNMKASNLHDAVKIHDEKLTREVGLTGSVMDYSNINVAFDSNKQGLYYDIAPGPYDVWAVQFGYSEFAPTEEEPKLKELLAKSAVHELLFGNDADDMRSAGHGIDPRVMIGDMSSDPVAYSVERLQLIDKTLPKLKDKFAKSGESYQGLRNAYFVLTSETGIALRVVSRQIGGVYVDRSVVEQPNASRPLTPVSYQKQKEALAFLNRYGFSPQAFKISGEIYSLLQMQRRGYDFFGINEDPKPHDRILNVHKDLMNQLLHVNTIQRILDTELYGNTYKLAEFAADLTDAIFKEDLNKTVTTARQNLQTEYVNRLISIQNVSSPYSNAAKAIAFGELNRIKKTLTATTAPDTATKAHRTYVVYLVDKMLNEK